MVQSLCKYCSCAGILEQSMEAGNRVGIGLSFKLLRNPGIDDLRPVSHSPSRVYRQNNVFTITLCYYFYTAFWINWFFLHVFQRKKNYLEILASSSSQSKLLKLFGMFSPRGYLPGQPSCQTGHGGWTRLGFQSHMKQILFCKITTMEWLQIQILI